MNDAKRPCPTLAEAVVELARHFSEDEGGHRQAWSVVVVALHEARADAEATHHAMLGTEADAKASEALAYAAGAEEGRAWAGSKISSLENDIAMLTQERDNAERWGGNIARELSALRVAYQAAVERERKAGERP